MSTSLLHDSLVSRVVSSHGASETGWGKAMRGLVEPGGFVPHLIPDAWSFDKESRTVCLWEVFIANPLNDDRLSQYAELWWELECEGVDLVLVEVDRYGVEHKHELAGIWFASLLRRIAQREERESPPVENVNKWRAGDDIARALDRRAERATVHGAPA